MARGKFPERKTEFRVLISGGGVAGLTLANCLQHAGIDYLLLEARNEVAPQLGASIGLGPNGSRILDQLGCYDDIMSLTQPIDYTGSHCGDTGNYIRPKTDGFKLVQARANYCMCFLDRQSVLQVLAEHIVDQQKVVLNKKIAKAEEHTHGGRKGVKVTCHDGTHYDGDILVGADGTHSVVRQEMWRAADVGSPGEIPESEKRAMSAEYQCVFGISTPIPGLTPRAFEVTYKKNISPIVITSKNGRVYWFLISRMAQVFTAGSIPRFSRDEARAFVEAHLDIPLMPDAKVTVRDLWENHETYNMVSLEEAYYAHWTYGRFAIIGDSVHKMTPNMGSGGNSAIESAAALANSLAEMLDRTDGATPGEKDIHSALYDYQETRKLRASRTVAASNIVTRLHAVKNYLYHVAAYYILPNAGDLLVDLAAENWIGSVKLAYMPVPQRSTGGTMPFNPQQGMGQNENLLARSLLASPFLLFLFLPSFVHRSFVFPAPTTALAPWEMLLQWRDTMDVALQALGIADFGILYAIIVVEAARRANLMTPLAFPVVFGLACQLFSATTILPIYYFLYASIVPISRFKASDLRLTDMSYTRSVLPAMLLCYYGPCLASMLITDEQVRHSASWIFRLSTLLIALVQWACSKAIFPSTIRQDRLSNVRRDLKTIRCAIGSLTLLSAVSWLRVVHRWFLPLFVSSLEQLRSTPSALLLSIVRQMSQNSYVVTAGASMLWVLYLCRDLKRAGMVNYLWPTIWLALATSTLLSGPGSTVAIAWLYREHILATRRHKGAIV